MRRLGRLRLPLAAFLLAGWAPMFELSAQPPEFVYRDRAVVRRPANFAPLSAKQREEYKSQVGSWLAIRQPAVLESDGFRGCQAKPGAFGPGNLLRIALAQQNGKPGNHQAVAQAVGAWLEQEAKRKEATSPAFRRLLEDWKRLGAGSADCLPMVLLGVVNRLDLAQMGSEADGACMGPRICGAELRFVYAGNRNVQPAGGPDYLRMIVEFVLPCLPPKEFVALAKDWRSLPPGDALAGKDGQLKLGRLLEGILRKPVETRIRVSVAPLSGTWRFREFAVRDGAIRERPLAREPRVLLGQCQPADSPIVKFAVANASQIKASRFEYPDALATPDASVMVFTDAPVLRLEHFGAGTEALRHALSLHSCTGCHGAEAEAPFFHFSYREPGTRAKLSNFLTGGKDGEPVLAGVFPVDVTPKLKKGCAAPGQTARYEYNDLRRRYDLLLRASRMKPSATAQDWSGLFARFSVRMAH